MSSPNYEYRPIEDDVKTIASNGDQPVTSFEASEFWQSVLTNDEQPVQPSLQTEEGPA